MIAPPQPPSYDELEALFREARRRQLRRRLLAAAAVAVVVAAGLAIYALTLGGSPGPTTEDARGPGGVPLCRSSQLAAQVEWPAGETPDGWVLLTNTSGSPCSLAPGVPRVSITWGGKLMATHEVHRLGLHPSEWTPLRTAHVLRHGPKAWVTFAWLNWCGRRHSYRRLMRGHLRFGRAVVSFDVGAHPPYQTCSSPSTVQVSRPLLVRSQDS
jgi:hypothetical protein